MEIAKTVAAIAVDLNQEFKDGVQTALAVPDFLLTDVLEESKSFQESFARLIAVSILQRKGVSVVSFEELEALQRESEIGATEIQRIVPLLIRGQFNAVKKEDMLSFDISLVILDGTGKEEIISKESVPETEVAKFLGSEVPNRIFERLGQQDDTVLTPEKQEEEFSQIATRFHEYGAYDLAVKYRQAILLLNPKNAIERLRMLSEMRSLGYGQTFFQTMYPHYKYLYTNKLISFEMGADTYFLTGNHELNRELLPLIFQLPPAQNKAESGSRFLWRAPTNDPRYEPAWGEDAPFPPVVLRQLRWRNLLRNYVNAAGYAAPETILADTVPVLIAYPENGIPNLTENERGHFRQPAMRLTVERDDERPKRFITELLNSQQEN